MLLADVRRGAPPEPEREYELHLRSTIDLLWALRRVVLRKGSAPLKHFLSAVDKGLEKLTEHDRGAPLTATVVMVHARPLLVSGVTKRLARTFSKGQRSHNELGKARIGLVLCYPAVCLSRMLLTDEYRFWLPVSKDRFSRPI